MLKKYDFSEKAWDGKDFRYAYSPACVDRVAFKQEEGGIVNGKSKVTDGYEYISMLDNTPRSSGVCVQTECSFESFGAPLIVFSGDLEKNEKGEWIYGKHFEVVAFEEGVNIWEIVPAAESGAVKPTLLAFKRFPVAENSRIAIKVQIADGKIKAWVNGEFLEVSPSDLPKEEIWVGITACEGINRFYSLTIED